MLQIPSYAKRDAAQALRQRQRLVPSKRYGLDRSQAQMLGIASGVSRAKQLIRNKTLPLSDAKRVSAFYQRFKNCRTPKCEGALDLWGGRRFGRDAVRYVKGK